MIDFIQTIFGSWADIVVAITAIITAASVIVQLTPTPKDDAILAKIKKVLELLALNKATK